MATSTADLLAALRAQNDALRKDMLAGFNALTEAIRGLSSARILKEDGGTLKTETNNPLRKE